MRFTKQHYGDLLGFGLIFGFLLFAYTPLLQIPFVFNDDFLIFNNPIKTCSDHPQFYYFFLIGRPVFPFLACPFWISIQSVADLAPARFVNLFTLSISAFMFFNWLKKNNFSLWPALLLSIIIFSSPTFHTQVVLANSFPHMVAILLSLLCGIQLCKWLEDGKRHRLFAATIFLFLPLCIHPCVAMFIWPVIFVYVYNHKSESRKTFYVLSWFFVVCCMYFFFAKFMNTIAPRFFYVTREIVGGHEVVVADDLSQCWYKFRHLCLAALNLWAVVPQAWILLSTVALLLTAVVIKSVQCIRSQGQCLIINNGFLLLTVPLSLLPILSAQHNALSYRMISGLTAIMILVLFLALRKTLEVLPVDKLRSPALTFVIFILAMVYVGQARLNITSYLAVPAHKEIEYAKKQLQHIHINQIDTIHVIRPEKANWLSSRLLGIDEFGLLSSSMPQNSKGLIRCAMNELQVDSKDIDRITITSGPFNERMGCAEDKTTAIVDMNEKTKHFFWR